eukprot:g149.t1
MCRFMGKSLFQILNLAIFFVSLATLIFGVYCLAKNGHFNPFSYTTIGLGCVLSVTSATLLSQGFKSKCKVGLHLFFLAALLVAECAGIIMYYDQECMVEGMVCKAWLIKQVPHNLQDAIESHMFIARWVLLGIGGAQAVAFLLGLALCRGIKKRRGKGGASERLLETEDLGRGRNSYQTSRQSDVPGSYDGFQQQSNIPIATSYRMKHKDLYEKYNIQMQN